MLEKGLSYQSTTIVNTENTASSMGSGDLQVFATPAMIALMENAAMQAVSSHLPEGSTTVGALMNCTHLKPSSLGDSIMATAILTEAEGRKLIFNVSASDSHGVIGEGTHIRYIVDRDKFLSKIK